MIVKIGDKKYDSEKEPIMIELSLQERELIAQMDQSATKYCSFPEGLSDVDIAKFMEIELGEEMSEDQAKAEEEENSETPKPEGEGDGEAKA